MATNRVTIRNWTYLQAHAAQKAAIMQAVQDVFESGRLILGERVAAFEQHFATYCGRRFGVGVNSGTDAIFLGLKALGVGAGDDVITVPNTAVPTVAAIREAGATPVFVDIDERTYLMDVGDVASRITPRTRAVVPVHLYGQCVNMEALLAMTRDRGIAVLEDCAQAHGATYHGCKAGAMGEVGAFSFYPTKVLGAYGDGGMCLTDDGQMAARLRRLRMYGMDGEYYSHIEGINSRLDEVQAAILDVKLRYLDEAIARRRQIARVYDEGLSGLVTLPALADGSTHCYYLYVIRHPDRDRLIAELTVRGIGVLIHFPVPIHLMEGYRFLGYREGDFPRAERVAREICSLPMYPELPDADVEGVINAVRDVLS